MTGLSVPPSSITKFRRNVTLSRQRPQVRVPSSPVYFQTRDSSEQHFTVVGLGNTVPGAFALVLAKHTPNTMCGTKHLSLVDTL